MMKNSRAINLSMKDISFVPDNVFEDVLTAEVHIKDPSKNKLSEVAIGLQKVSFNITEFNLSTNKIKSLPEYIGDFSRLQYLNLSKNLLKDLPSSLSVLHNLRELVLSNNVFILLPDCIYDCEMLKILLASDNKITTINVDGLKRLKRLATLDFSNNNIDNVPLELGNLKQLRCLEIKENSFRLPRYAVLEQGTDSILSYLRDRIPK